MNRKILFLCFVGIIIWPYILSAQPVGIGPPVLWNDELWKLYDNGDTTKRLELELENITTGNTRTWTVPDYDVVANGFIDWTDASANFKTTGSLTVDTDTLVVDNVNNRVGIGTTVPNAPLEVKGVKPGNVGGFQSGMFHVTGAGTAEFYNSVITGHNAYNTNTQLWYLGNTSSGNDDIAFINRQNAAMHFYTNNASRMSIDAAGNVGIGTSTPSEALDLANGNLKTTGAVWCGGLGLEDTDSSHYLAFRCLSNLSANKLLDFVPGDSARTITLTGNPTLADWFDQGVKTTDDVIFATTGGVTITGGNISGADVDIDAGTGDITSTGDTVLGRTGVGGYQSTFLGNTLFGAVGSAYGASGYFIAGEGQSTQFFLYADEGDDNADKWRMLSAAGTNYLQIQNKTSGSFVDKLFLAPGGEIYMPAVYSDSHGGTGRAMYIQSNGQLTCDTSARRFKENIKDLSDTSWIYDLTPREADWKDSNVKADPVLVAEEVQQVHPKLVSYQIETIYADPNIGQEDEIIITDVPEGVYYYKLLVPMLKEIQILRVEIDELKIEVEELKAR